MTLAEFTKARIADDDARALNRWLEGCATVDEAQAMVDAYRKSLTFAVVRFTIALRTLGVLTLSALPKFGPWWLRMYAARFADHPDYNEAWRQ